MHTFVHLLVNVTDYKNTAQDVYCQVWKLQVWGVNGLIVVGVYFLMVVRMHMAKWDKVVYENSGKNMLDMLWE